MRQFCCNLLLDRGVVEQVIAVGRQRFLATSRRSFHVLWLHTRLQQCHLPGIGINGNDLACLMASVCVNNVPSIQVHPVSQLWK